MSDRRPSTGQILQSESPDISVIQAHCIKQEDYRSQIWKNGLGKTDEIEIYPPKKDFTKDHFFWRLSINEITANCNFSMFPGYDCTTVVLPGKDETHKPYIILRHQDNESSNRVQPFFPYSWKGEWSTTCKVSNPPVRNIKLMLKRGAGKSQVQVEKISRSKSGHPYSDPSKNKLFGSFALIYVIEGYVSITLDENNKNEQTHELKEGQTLFIERDEESDPTSFSMNATDSTGKSSQSGIEASVVIITIEEGKTFGGIMPTQESKPLAENETEDTGDIVPSKFRPTARRPSLLTQLEKLGNRVEPTRPLASLTTRRDSVPGLDSDVLSQLNGSFDSSGIYVPPIFALMHNETDMPPPVTRDKLEVTEFPIHSISTAWIKMMTHGLSEWIKLPVIVCRGTEDGPIVGITAAVHGNELNGLPAIHRVVSQIDVNKLKGTVVAVPCVNVWGYLKFQREFADGRDLNRQFPGKQDGYASQVYCYYLMKKIISQFNYMVDLHTASFGRVNSYYVRADMNDPAGEAMAILQQPEIVLHNSGQDGTLRSAAAARGIKAITVEIGNPQTFQDRYVQWAFMGIMRILDHFKMFSLDHVKIPQSVNQSEGPSHTVLCSKGFWLYTKVGGILEVYPDVNTFVRKGEIIAHVKNMFGNVIDEYFSPCTGMVIGRSSNPVAMAGDRIVHMGIIKKTSEALGKADGENY